MSTIKTFLRIFWFPLLVAAAFSVIAIVGFQGWETLYQRYQIEHSFWTLAYATLQLFTLDAPLTHSTEGNAKLQCAMFLAPMLIAYTALQSVYLLLRERLQRLGRHFLKDHVIVCGFGKRGEALAQSFKKQGNKVVVIDPADTPGIQNRCRKSGALMLCGRAESDALLREARLDRAKYLFAVCGDERVNADIAVTADNLAKKSPQGQLTCFIHISNRVFHRLMIGKMLADTQPSCCRIELFNLYETAALALIREHPPLFIYNVTDHSFRDKHFVVIGSTPFSDHLIVHFARLWWENRPCGDTFKVTLAADNADQHIKTLNKSYPTLASVCQLEAGDDDLIEKLVEKGSVDKVYVCLETPTKSLARALELGESSHDSESVLIIAVVDHLDGLSTLCQNFAGKTGRARIDVFPALDRTCGADPLLASANERLARAIHEDYILQQRRSGHYVMDNPAMVSWEALPETLRDSNRQQARDISSKLKAAGLRLEPSTDWQSQRFEFSQEEIEKLARLEHERWMQERIASGWHYGVVKDIDKKISPCLVSWEELPEDEKEKDRDSVRNLPLLIGMVGFKIVRDPNHTLAL